MSKRMAAPAGIRGYKSRAETITMLAPTVQADGEIRDVAVKEIVTVQSWYDPANEWAVRIIGPNRLEGGKVRVEVYENGKLTAQTRWLDDDNTAYLAATNLVKQGRAARHSLMLSQAAVRDQRRIARRERQMKAESAGAGVDADANLRTAATPTSPLTRAETRALNGKRKAKKPAKEDKR